MLDLNYNGPYRVNDAKRPCTETPVIECRTTCMPNNSTSGMQEFKR